jgi:signal transduction histidine kinase
VTVHDQGIGIAPEEREKVFEPYYRSSDAIKRKVQGTGLGLFLADGFVKAHGGTLTIESPGVGLGTTVTIVLPRHTQE